MTDKGPDQPGLDRASSDAAGETSATPIEPLQRSALNRRLRSVTDVLWPGRQGVGRALGWATFGALLGALAHLVGVGPNATVLALDVRPIAVAASLVIVAAGASRLRLDRGTIERIRRTHTELASGRSPVASGLAVLLGGAAVVVGYGAQASVPAIEIATAAVVALALLCLAGVLYVFGGLLAAASRRSASSESSSEALRRKRGTFAVRSRRWGMTASGSDTGVQPRSPMSDGMPFETMRLPSAPTGIAPDGSDVRVLLGLAGGGMAQFALASGRVSTAVRHRTVEEIWYFIGGSGAMWRRQGDREAVVPVEAGVCLTIPVGTSFQFRAASGPQPLTAIGVTMPPWPGPQEAEIVGGYSVWTTEAEQRNG